MGWKNLPSIFFMDTETVADLANAAVRRNTTDLPHTLDDMAEEIFKEALTILHLELAGLMRDPYLRRSNTKLATYVDFFVNSFLGLAQGPAYRRHQVRQTLFHALDMVFWSCESGNLANRK